MDDNFFGGILTTFFEGTLVSVWWGDSYFNEFLNFALDIPTSCSILFTDSKTVFVFAVGHFLPLVVKFCRQCVVLKGY